MKYIYDAERRNNFREKYNGQTEKKFRRCKKNKIYYKITTLLKKKKTIWGFSKKLATIFYEIKNKTINRKQNIENSVPWQRAGCYQMFVSMCEKPIFFERVKGNFHIKVDILVNCLRIFVLMISMLIWCNCFGSTVYCL